MDELRIVLPENGKDRVSILAAVSGGADSVALLALLKEAAKTNPLILTAAHFEHGIRAEASRADAAFVHALCESWGIPLIAESADVPRLAREWNMGLEEAARAARYGFLRRARVSADADYIALAHHRDDQVETVLMHLFRGSGLRGMVGMKRIEGDLYRPLLDYPKETLVSYLRGRGIRWCEDATNEVPDNPRNALRLNVIPEIEKIYPGADSAVARFSGIAGEEDSFLERMTDEFLSDRALKLPFGWMLELRSIAAQCESRRAIILRAIRKLTGLDYESVRRIFCIWINPDSARSVSLEGGWRAERGRQGLYLMNGGWNGIDEIPLPESGERALPGELGRVTVRKGYGTAVYDNPFCQELDAEALRGAVIRTRRDGDMICPLGAPGRQKLSDYFTNKRVDRPVRDLVPLIARENEILWAMGIGISEKAKLTMGSTAARIELTGWPLQKFGGKDNA
ncbi:MAG: tRNA lysidine(34) synthetase TilS [Clostridia bacterium]|nr:tRNA lysidine(34) synthetase TilS [Clostridia bacterium]